jgi:hypothetical protein
VKGDVELVSLAPSDFRSVLMVVAGMQPDEIYNLAGQASVGSTATLNLLAVIRFLGAGIRFYCAGSSECFGDTGQTPATEENADAARHHLLGGQPWITFASQAVRDPEDHRRTEMKLQAVDLSDCCGRC